MHSFTDTTGRTWELTLTIGAAKRVKGILGVDLLDLAGGNPPLITRLHTDAMLLIDTIFVILKPAAEAAGVTDEQFGEALGGDAAWNAYQAFTAELEDFFRQFHRPDLERTVAVERKMLETRPQEAAVAVDRIATAIEKMATEEIEQIVQEVEAKRPPISGSGSTNLPESSAFSPTP
jgi:hypothetical protein